MIPIRPRIVNFNVENIDVQNAFRIISGQLNQIPDEYCYWSKRNSRGTLERQTLNDYRDRFSFIRNPSLRENLGELRMVLDYHRNIYYLIDPAMTFRRHHKLVIYQTLGAITEGLLSDYAESIVNQSTERIVKFLCGQRARSKGFGLGSLIEMCKQTDVFGKDSLELLENLKRLRDSIHPKSLNKNTTYLTNPIMNTDVNEVIDIFDKLIVSMEARYRIKKLV